MFTGITSGTLDLIVWAAVMMSFQLFGCHASGSPAWANNFLLNQIARTSVPSGMPYVLPSSAWAAPLAFSLNWLQSVQPFNRSSSGVR